MKTPLAAIMSLALAACGGSPSRSDASDDPVEDPSDDPVEEPDADDPMAEDVHEEEPAPDPCPESYTLHEGENPGFMVAGESRWFELVLPDGEDTGPGPWPVIFLWHEKELSPSWMREATGVADLAGELDFPYIAVLPAEASRSLPTGWGWEMLQVEDPETNPDVLLFDCILETIDGTFGVDHDRVYSVGFSTGAIMTNLLSIARNDVVSATVAYSGSFYSDAAQVKCLGTACTEWPAAITPYKFQTVVLEGGTGDVFDILGVLYLDFHADALATLSYMALLGHEVIYCPHASGHDIPTDFVAAQFVRFFKDHPRGTRPSPYATAMPTIFPGACEYRAPD